MTNKKIKLTFIGDLLCHSDQIENAYNQNTGKYEFTPSFSKIKKYFSDSDYVVGNLETPIGRNDYQHSESRKGFCAPPEYLEALIDMGVDLFLTANNHCLDQGVAGLKQTLSALEAYGVENTGTRISPKYRRFILKDIAGIKIAFINYTFGVNYNVHGCLPDNISGMVNILSRPELQSFEELWNRIPRFLTSSLLEKVACRNNTITKTALSTIEDTIKTDIQDAKRLGADIVIVLPHAGVEFTDYPLHFMHNLVRQLFSYGADIVIGGHPHVLQPMAFYEIGDAKKFVAYSLGNFITSDSNYWPSDKCMSSMILNLYLEMDSERKVKVTGVSVVPTYIEFSKQENCYQVCSLSDLIRDANVRGEAEKYGRIQQRTLDLVTGGYNEINRLEEYLITLSDSSTPYHERRIYDTISFIEHIIHKAKIFLSMCYRGVE